MDYPWQNPAIWHAINVHLPITLAVLGLPLLCVVAITRGRHRALRWSTVALYAVVTVSAWFAAETGVGAMEALSASIPAAAAERVNFHEWMAQWVWVLAGVTTLLLLLANIPRRWARQTFTTLALIFSVTTVIWVMVTAHSGGVAVYDHGLGTVAMRDGTLAGDNVIARARADGRVNDDDDDDDSDAGARERTARRVDDTDAVARERTERRTDDHDALARAQADSLTRKREETSAKTQATTAPVAAVAPIVAPVTAQPATPVSPAQFVSYSKQIEPLLKQRC